MFVSNIIKFLHDFILNLVAVAITWTGQTSFGRKIIKEEQREIIQDEDLTNAGSSDTESCVKTRTGRYAD